MSENKKLIIGFTGRVGSGKDTASEFTEDYFGTSCLYFAWADILKNIVHDTFGISSSGADLIKRQRDIKPFNGKTIREVYQQFGESIKSHFGERVWVDQTLKELKYAQSSIQADLILCTDIRYSYEEAALRKFAEDEGFDCLVIRMTNLRQPQRTDHMSISEIQHISEIQDNIKADFDVKAADLHDMKSQLESIYESEFK